RAHGEWAVALETVLRHDHHNLAVLHLPYELGADDIECARLGREHVGRAKATDYKRAEANGIARADEHVIGQTHEGIGALDLAQGFDKALDDSPLLRAGDEVEQDLRIRGRLENGPRLDELATERQGIGQVAIVANGEAATFEIGEERLHVTQDRLARGRVADMPDGHLAA